jgi:DNA-binding NarL/FixJ family response regulator
LSISGIRVLLVDDFEPFRKFLSSKLQNGPGIRVIDEASDGLEAVRKAQELQPDLILLDIGLPSLSGIEAAQRIREVSPASKILFISQESSADVVCKALSSGGWGYVVKTDAVTELLPALNKILRGERFIGARFADHDFTDCTGAE